MASQLVNLAVEHVIWPEHISRAIYGVLIAGTEFTAPLALCVLLCVHEHFTGFHVPMQRCQNGLQGGSDGTTMPCELTLTPNVGGSLRDLGTCKGKERKKMKLPRWSQGLNVKVQKQQLRQLNVKHITFSRFGRFGQLSTEYILFLQAPSILTVKCKHQFNMLRSK